MKKVRLWTIQDIRATNKLLQSGTLRTDGRRVSYSFRTVYKVMMDQMTKRLPEYRGSYPIWCWYSPKPDLRNKAHLPAGTRGALIEIEVEVSRVLLSDFNSWHLILNGSPRSKKVLDSIFNQGKFAKDTIIQGVVEKIDLQDVARVKYFVAR